MPETTVDHDQFGPSFGGSRWFVGDQQFRDVPVRPVMRHWMCPIEGCGGEMFHAGWSWPTLEPGHHHTCSECGFTAAISGKTYPSLVWEAVEDA